MMETPGLSKLAPMVRNGDDGKPRRMVAYLSSYPPKDGETPEGMNVVMMDPARIVGAVHNIELFNKGRVLILSHDNELLFSNRDPTDDGGPEVPLDALAGVSGGLRTWA